MKTFEDFYVKKDYSNALLTLQKSPHGIPMGLLHYNLGTVHSKMEHWPLARYHFLLAERAGFDSPELLQNKEFVEGKLETVRLERPLSLSDYLVKAGLTMQDGILTSLSLLSLVVGLIVLKKKASVLRIIGWSVLALLPVVVDFWVGQWPQAITVEAEGISEGPSAIFNNSGELPAGVFVITKGEGDWKEIIYPARFKGWVKASALKKLE